MAKDKQKIQLTRQKKMAKQKAKAKAAKQHQVKQGVPFELRFGLSRAAIQQAPVFGAWVSEETFKSGMGTLIIARELDNDLIAAGIFLVDAWCLGVKNAFFRSFSPAFFEEMLTSTHEREPLEVQSPEYAAKLIGDVIDFSRNLGFPPHADYGDASSVLAGIDRSLCAEIFVFGKEGKPFYFAGPHDTPSRSQQICSQLATACGEGNYHFMLPVGQSGKDFGDFEEIDSYE